MKQKRLTAQMVRDMLRVECRNFGGIKAWAQQAGISAQYAGEVINGRREPGDSILKPLGLVKVVEYERVPS